MKTGPGIPTFKNDISGLSTVSGHPANTRNLPESV
jgi:hypothetical protein